MKVDVLLGPHPESFGMEAKLKAMKDGAPNPFVNPGENASYVAQMEKGYDDALAKQTAAAKN
jgi:metallo-beta-lactamase class B